MTLLLKKRLFSSPAAFLETLREHMRTLGRSGAAEQVSEGRLRAAFERLDEDVDPTTRSTSATQDALTTAARAVDPLSQGRTKRCSTRMLAWAEQRGPSPRRQGRGRCSTWLDRDLQARRDAGTTSG